MKSEIRLRGPGELSCIVSLVSEHQEALRDVSHTLDLGESTIPQTYTPVTDDIGRLLAQDLLVSLPERGAPPGIDDGVTGAVHVARAICDSIGPRWNRLLIRDKCDVVSVHAVWQPAQNKTGQHNEEGHRHAALLGEDLLPIHGRVLIHPLHVFLNLLKYPYIAEQHDS